MSLMVVAVAASTALGLAVWSRLVRIEASSFAGEELCSYARGVCARIRDVGVRVGGEGNVDALREQVSGFAPRFRSSSLSSRGLLLEGQNARVTQKRIENGTHAVQSTSWVTVRHNLHSCIHTILQLRTQNILTETDPRETERPHTLLSHRRDESDVVVRARIVAQTEKDLHCSSVMAHLHDDGQLGVLEGDCMTLVGGGLAAAGEFGHLGTVSAANWRFLDLEMRGGERQGAGEGEEGWQELHFGEAIL